MMDGTTTAFVLLLLVLLLLVLLEGSLLLILLALILASNFVAPNSDNTPTDTNLNEKLDNREIPATPVEDIPGINDSL